MQNPISSSVRGKLYATIVPVGGAGAVAATVLPIIGAPQAWSQAILAFVSLYGVVVGILARANLTVSDAEQAAAAIEQTVTAVEATKGSTGAPEASAASPAVESTPAAVAAAPASDLASTPAAA